MPGGVSIKLIKCSLEFLAPKEDVGIEEHEFPVIAV